MHRPRIQNSIAWLCILTFGLQCALGALGLMECTHANGSTHIGSVWARDTDGCCPHDAAEGALPADDGCAAPSSHPGENLPCKDKPLHDDSRCFLRGASAQTHRAAFPAPVAVIVPWIDPLPAQHDRPVCKRRTADPGVAISPLKTIILLV